MDRSVTWERIGAASGIAFVALLLASFLVIPDSAPALDAPVGKIRAYYVDNSSSFQASLFLTGLAGFFLLGFLGALTTTLSRADAGGWLHRVVVPAGAVVLSVVFVSAGVTDALATRVAAESDQAVIRALYDVQAFTITFTAFPIAVLVGAVSVVSRRARLMPPLVSVLGLLLVPAWLVSGFAVFTETGAFSPTGGFGLIVLLAWLAWVLAVSASLLRRSGTAPVADAA
jgi:hypothetical protein